MRVLIASFHLEHELSGEAEGVRSLVEILRAEGFSMSVFGIGRIPRVSHSRERIFSKLNNLIALPKMLASQAREVDAVLLFLPTPAFSFLGDLAAIRIAKPLIVRFDSHLVNGSLLQTWIEAFRDPFFFLPRILINNQVIARIGRRRAQTYLVSSAEEKEQLVSIGYDPSTVLCIPNTSRLSDAADDSDTADNSGFMEFPPGFKIGYIGHFFHIKGVSILLEAFAEVKDKTARLILAWSGLGDRSLLEKKIRQLGLQARVSLLGRVPVCELLQVLDVLALPYLHTYGTVSYPNIVLEAISVGIPLIVSDHPTLRGLLAGETNPAAVFVPPGNRGKLAAALELVMSNQDLRAGLVSSQRALFAQKLKREKIAASYRALFDG